MADGPVCPAPLEPADDSALRARLVASHVAVIGCGGLGSNVAMLLVRAGVGELTLIDFDRVEPSNLNRQMFFADQLGMPKAEALAQTLRRISPDVSLSTRQDCVTADNLLELIDASDLVVEAVDRAETKALIVNKILADAPQMPLVSASGLAGFDSANEIVTERLGDGFYVVGDMRSDVTNGLPLFSSRVMTAAAHQAHIAIRYLLGYPEP